MGDLVDYKQWRPARATLRRSSGAQVAELPRRPPRRARDPRFVTQLLRSRRNRYAMQWFGMWDEV